MTGTIDTWSLFHRSSQVLTYREPSLHCDHTEKAVQENLFPNETAAIAGAMEQEAARGERLRLIPAKKSCLGEAAASGRDGLALESSVLFFPNGGVPCGGIAGQPGSVDLLQYPV